ncbi:DNA polymerase III subunit beta, partial [Desulfonatronospira sp.]|uniref:DNA polymerase III subunit beta n=1 Tax=Desulfonatronospira sp. TaxID=1962951 RepID=UPI0025B972AE
DSVKIMSTDSNVEFIGEYRAEIKQEGFIGTPGRRITDLIKKLRSGPITIKSSPDKEIILVKQDKRFFKLPLSDSSWFPELDEFPEDGDIAVFSGDKLRDILEKSLFCISDDDTMQGMTCLKIALKEASMNNPQNDVPDPSLSGSDGEAEEPESRVEACAFNGHQLSLYTFETAELRQILPEKGVLIPKKYLLDLRKWIPAEELEICITETKIFLRTIDKRESFSLPLSMHQFPNYRDFINTYSNKLDTPMLVNKDELVESLERILIFNTDSQQSTLMKLGSSEIKMTSTAADSGEAEEIVPCKYSGRVEQIYFNTKGLLELMGHIDEDTVMFRFSGSVEPCKINGATNEEYFVMTMPVQIEEETYYTEEEME